MISVIENNLSFAGTMKIQNLNMKKIDQEYHCQSVVGDHGNQIIDRCNEWTGSNRRINMDLVEEHRNDSSDKA